MVAGSKERIQKEVRTRCSQGRDPDEPLPSTRLYLSPPHNAMIPWIHWRIDPFVRSELSWSNCLWKCLQRVEKKCTSLISCICRSCQVDSGFIHYRNVGKVEWIWKMVVLDGQCMLLINIAAKYFSLRTGLIQAWMASTLWPSCGCWDYKPPYLPLNTFFYTEFFIFCHSVFK